MPEAFPGCCGMCGRQYSSIWSTNDQMKTYISEIGIPQGGWKPMTNVHQSQNWRALLIMRHQIRSQQAAAARMARARRRAGHKLKIS